MDFFGLLGEKLGHSVSPQIHNSILKNIDRGGDYKLFEVERGQISKFISSVKLFKIKGFNVTIPYKEEVINYLDNISDEAERIGAVNTVLCSEGKLYGYNTDYYGFGATFKQNNINFKDKITVILGAGGACKAALTYILDNDVKRVYIVSRNPKDVKIKVDDNRLSIIEYEELKKIKGDIIINSTPVGMYPNIEESPVDEDIIKNYKIVMDLIYNPLETRFLYYGRKNNKVTLDGLYMLVGQAVKAQEIFQDITISDQIIDSIYEEVKEGFN